MRGKPVKDKILLFFTNSFKFLTEIKVKMYFAVLNKKLVTVVLSVIVCIALITFCLFGTGLVSANTKVKRKLPIYRVNTQEKKLAISFDCAWGVDYTDKLISIMQEEKAIHINVNLKNIQKQKKWLLIWYWHHIMKV